MPEGDGRRIDEFPAAPVAETTPPSAPAGTTPFDAPTIAAPPLPLSIGHDFGTRYHIIRTLGAGGMGAVYQAWDKVLEVAVAIKVIRPDVTMSPEEAKALEKRFKRELLLARQVTHRNVVRIHDLGELDGITYITMPFVQGSDLATVLKREGRLSVERVVHIARQVASGLAAAHEAGVVHRDLKPANIMLDEDDGALIMDFGIARSTSSTGIGMTVAGAVVGTVAYMAPEQAQGAPVDQRADIYSFGLILHDMLVGRPRSGPSTAVSELMRRILTPPAPVRTVDPTIPTWLDEMITRCLQPDPAARYQSMNEVVAILEYGDGTRPTGTATAWPMPPAPAPVPVAPPTPQPFWQRTIRNRWLQAAALAIVVAGTGFVAWRTRATSAPQPPVAVAPLRTVSLAVLPFRNATNDSTLDALGPNLSQVLATMLGQSAHVRTVPPDRLNQVLRDLRISADAALTPTELARVADFTSTHHVLWGQISRFANTIRLDATLQDLEGNETTPLSAAAPNEEALLTAISELAGRVQTHLARGSSDVLSDLKSTAWRPSTNSFEALRLYNDGVRLTQQGTHQAALKSFQAAVQEDGNFALAISALARSYATLGYDSEATKNSREAMALSETLPAQEKHRIAANHYNIINDAERALQSYEAILKASPGDVMMRFTLGSLYEQRGALDEARAHLMAVVEDDPKFVEALIVLGRVEIRRGNPQESLQYLDRARTLSIELGNREARANAIHAIGVANMRLNRPDEALKHYQESIEIKREIGDKRGMAASLVQIGEVQRSQGEPKLAEQSYREALALRREIGDKAGVSLTLMELGGIMVGYGRSREALPYFQEALTILRETGNQTLEARALNNIGAVQNALGNYAEAQTYLERALEIREKAKAPQEAADTLHNLGEALAMMGRYEQSLQRFVRALELRRSAGDKRGAALAQYGIGTILDLQGRYGAAVEAMKEGVQVFRELGVREASTGELLSGYGRALALSGRAQEADAPLQEALTVANELRNNNLIAQISLHQAERRYFGGDLGGAQKAAAQAEQAAKQTSNRGLILQAQATVAMLASAQTPSRALANRFSTLAKEAETLGLRALAVDCTVYRASTLLRLGDRTAAAQEADRAITAAEALGLRVAQAKAHHVRASALQTTNAAESRREFTATVRLLEQVRSDTGNDKVLERADLASIHTESLQGSRSSSVPQSDDASPQ